MFDSFVWSLLMGLTQTIIKKIIVVKYHFMFDGIVGSDTKDKVGWLRSHLLWKCRPVICDWQPEIYVTVSKYNWTIVKEHDEEWGLFVTTIV